MKRIGAVVVFKPEVTLEQAALALSILRTVASSDVQEYDDEEGTAGPVFYIP